MGWYNGMGGAENWNIRVSFPYHFKMEAGLCLHFLTNGLTGI